MSTGKLFTIIFLSAVMGGIVAVIGINYVVLGKAMEANLISPAEISALKTSNEDVSQTANGTNQNLGRLVAGGSGMATSPVDREEEIVEGIYEKLSPTVVNITSVQYTYDIWRGGLVPQKGTGSGVLIDNEGYILTNNHVIEPALTNRGEIYVTYANGESEDAVIIGADAISDIAVIKLKNKPDKNFPTAPLGDSDKIKVGARAITIGNPFGLEGTCTVGIISALNRTIKVDNQELEGMIQTDATINPGNSGGPLINSRGEVIGITSVIFSQSGGSEGIGFAIPINAAKKIMNDLMKYGKVRRPYLGIYTFPILPTLTTYLKLPVSEGLLIQVVENNSPAQKAGLIGGDQAVAFRHYKIYVGGDIVISLNGEKMTDPLQFEKAIRKMEIGDKVTLEIIRGNKRMKVSVVLETRP